MIMLGFLQDLFGSVQDIADPGQVMDQLPVEMPQNLPVEIPQLDQLADLGGSAENLPDIGSAGDQSSKK